MLNHLVLFHSVYSHRIFSICTTDKTELGQICLWTSFLNSKSGLGFPVLHSSHSFIHSFFSLIFSDKGDPSRGGGLVRNRAARWQGNQIVFFGSFLK